ncbi:DUF3649 domain-containing protein [Massilia oculi]|jgi:hypothetical protein|uniref:Iron transporter n=1 Tax=Massilia oculi TaxID=945844 RepID=A0A2S2DEW0_9BURK|nr:DUF3649 domain-containing protein [Massilia oculi]AWL03629.1 iron transporter [Massilia oculi]
MTTLTWRYRGGVAARAAAAIGGGYVLTAIASALIAIALPLPRADAVTIATLLSFVVYTCVILWVFATGSALRAWVGVVATSGVLGAILWLAGRTS